MILYLMISPKWIFAFTEENKETPSKFTPTARCHCVRDVFALHFTMLSCAWVAALPPAQAPPALPEPCPLAIVFCVPWFVHLFCYLTSLFLAWMHDDLFLHWLRGCQVAKVHKLQFLQPDDSGPSFLSNQLLSKSSTWIAGLEFALK